jgi:hypothetical protein
VEVLYDQEEGVTGRLMWRRCAVPRRSRNGTAPGCSGAPQSPQNLIPAALSSPQCAHLTQSA